MKKLILLFSFFISACASINIFSDNENCLTTNEFKVLQALDDGALAYECTLWDGCSIWNQIVFLKRQLNVDYYDGMIVQSPDKKCAVRNGVYTYVNREEMRKTVPVITFEYKNEPKTEEEYTERVDEFGRTVNDACLRDMKATEEKVDEKFCNCYSDEATEMIVKIHNGEETYDEKTFNEQVKKKCGKLPKFMK